MKALTTIKLLWGFTYNQLAYLFDSTKGRIYSVRGAQTGFSALEREFELWLHQEGLQFTHWAILNEGMARAHISLNAEVIEMLNSRHRYLLKQEKVQERALSTLRSNFFYDLKAYAAMQRIEEIIPEKFSTFKERLVLLKRQYTLAYRKSRFTTLYRREAMLARTRAELKAIEDVLNMQFSDPDGIAK